VSDCSRPKEKLKKFHILILVASKPSLNPFIVNFLRQFTESRAWEIQGLKVAWFIKGKTSG